MISYLNGNYMDEKSIAISPLDRGFTLGDGVFDTMLVINRELQSAGAHFARLKRDATVIGIETDCDFEDVAKELLSKSNIQTGRYIIRTQITRGIGERGLALPTEILPTIIMRIMETPEPVSSPATAVIARRMRRNEFSPFSKIKSLNYGENILALVEAKAEGADEVILLNTKGFVACASASNIFIRETDKWFTPPLSDGVLAGIMRAQLIVELKAAEESITPERLSRAHEILQCNSVIGSRKLIMQP